MSKKVKIFAIVVVLIAAGIWGVSKFGGTSAPQSTVPSLTSSNVAGPAPKMPAAETKTGLSDFSALLSSVRGITIDTSIFSNQAYKTLRDHPVDLGTDTVGRANPFAPIGTDQDSGVTATPSVLTVQPGKITTSSAELGAQVTLKDTVPVTVVFEYGITDAFGTASTPVSAIKSGTVLTTITGLTPSTSYYVRAVVVRGSTTTTGNTVTFITAAAPAR
jgi:hypothetical protein